MTEQAHAVPCEQCNGFGRVLLYGVNNPKDCSVCKGTGNAPVAPPAVDREALLALLGDVRQWIVTAFAHMNFPDDEPVPERPSDLYTRILVATAALDWQPAPAAAAEKAALESDDADDDGETIFELAEKAGAACRAAYPALYGGEQIYDAARRQYKAESGAGLLWQEWSVGFVKGYFVEPAPTANGPRLGPRCLLCGGSVTTEGTAPHCTVCGRLAIIAGFEYSEDEGPVPAAAQEPWALLEEARFHVTVERDEHGIHQCSHCNLAARIDAALAQHQPDAAAQEETVFTYEQAAKGLADWLEYCNGQGAITYQPQSVIADQIAIVHKGLPQPHPSPQVAELAAAAKAVIAHRDAEEITFHTGVTLLDFDRLRAAVRALEAADHAE